MASTSDSEPWLLILETIKHHCKEERFEQYILDMMWERGKIELAYIKSLQQWADDFTNRCEDKDVPYGTPVIDVLVLPAREARSQANQHQRLYNALMSGDGPCIKLRTAITDLRNSIMPLSSQRVFTTLVSQFISLHNQKREHGSNVAKWKQHFARAQSAAVAVKVGGKVNIKRNNQLSRPFSARKMETLQCKQFHLKRFADIQEQQLKGAEKVLSDFMNSQTVPLKSMQDDLWFFATIRLADIVKIIKLFMQRLQGHEKSSERKEKRKSLVDCEKFLTNFTSSNFGEENLENLKIKVNETVKRRLSTDCSLENFTTVDIGERFSSELLTTELAILPSEQIPSEIELFAVQQQNMVLHSFRPRLEGSPAADNPGERGPIAVGRQNKKLHSPQTSLRQQTTCADVATISLRDTWTHPAPASNTPNINSWFTASNSEGIEVLELPIEMATLSKETLPWVVRDFCIASDEDTDNCLVSEPTWQRIKKRIVTELIDTGSKTDVTEFCEQKDDSERSESPCESESDSSSGESDLKNPIKNAAQLSNVRVVATRDYKANNENELTFSKGQIIHQKCGEDEYGFSYGWTKTSKFGSKKYGHYPSHVIQITDD
ncbi:uncharacterized protein LOC121382244 isoform X1 [Gigantopelta aegis]|uniref:uncharacterized protein LOC121382244 isoform X1 n=1 Tax=Gigantopelta aegis TaxID=1735272 RepID=UPI001B8882D9|nr:uncharacterized protein LOC121382244 isoform X1 [Gigantopelta aegis]